VLILDLVIGRSLIENTKYIAKEVKEDMGEIGHIFNLIDPTISSDNLTSLGEFVNQAMRCVQCPGANCPTMGDMVKEIEEII